MDEQRPYNQELATLEGYETAKELDQYKYRRQTAQLYQSTIEYADKLEEKIKIMLKKAEPK